MKVLTQPVTYPLVFQVRRVIRTRTQMTRWGLTATSWRAYDSWPAITNEIRALDLTLKFATPSLDRAAARQGTAQTVSGGKLLNAIYRVGAALEAIAEWARELALKDQARLSKFTSGEVDAAQAAVASGLPDLLAPADLNMDAVQEMVLYALKGTAPRRTQAAVAAHTLDYLSLQVTATDTMEDLIGQICYVRLGELLNSILSTPTVGAGTLNAALTIKREEAYRQRVQALSQLSSRMLAIPKSAYLMVAEHCKQALLQPWLLKVSYGELSDSIFRAVHQHEAAGLKDTAFSPWPELSGNVVDPDFTGLNDGLVATNQKAPKPMIAEPPDSQDLGNPLEQDLARVNNVPEAVVSRLLDRFWLASAGAEKASQLCEDALDADPALYPSVPALPGGFLPSVEGGLAEFHRLDGYPLYDGERDPVRIWPAARFSLHAIRPALSAWRSYTRQFIVDAMVKASDGFFPVSIRGGARTEDDPVQLMPIFGNFTDHVASLQPSASAIARAWGFQLPHFRAFIKHQSPMPESNQLRRLAQALRFVGQIRIAEKKLRPKLEDGVKGAYTEDSDIAYPHTTLVGEPVLPEDRHWYHGLEHVECLQLNGARWLGSIGENSDTQDVWFFPFAALPSTSRWDQAWWNLAIQPVNTELKERALVRWVSSQKSAPLTAITAWHIGDPAELVYDIIAINVGDADPREIVLMGRTDKKPTAIRHENAVLSISPPGLPSWSPAVLALPAPASDLVE